MPEPVELSEGLDTPSSPPPALADKIPQGGWRQPVGQNCRNGIAPVPGRLDTDTGGKVLGDAVRGNAANLCDSPA